MAIVVDRLKVKASTILIFMTKYNFNIIKMRTQKRGKF